MSQGIRRIGVSTGGGDAPGLNAVIRAVVKAATNKYGWEVMGIFDGFDGLIHLRKAKLLTPLMVRGILPRGGTILGASTRGNPFAYPVTVKGKTVLKDLSDTVIRNMKRLRLDALVVIGGDGTLNITYELYQKGCPVVGVPKTIDNDLSATDKTFGFSTAVTTATEALDKLHTTAESHHRIIVLEVMGRNAGWIALEAGIAGGADAILIPEIPYDIQRVSQRIRERCERGSRFSLVVVAEGARPKGGKQSYVETNVPGRLPRLGGIGNQVGEALARATGMDTRVTVLGHLQRGGSPTAYDRLLATRFGVAAVDLVARGGFGRMVCLRGQRIASVALSRAVSRMKAVPSRGELVQTAEALGITFGR